MASIERTAYPRMKRTPTAKELQEIYTPKLEEVEFSYRAARGAENRLTLLVLLKVFQRLGYFPALADVPLGITAHIASCLRLKSGMVPGYDNQRTLYRHHKAIREYLEVIPYGRYPRHVATEAIFRAAQVMDNPADLINVAIEELIRQRCELPGFSTLDRLTRRIRALVNQRFFTAVLARISREDRGRLDSLLDVTDASRRSEFSFLKEPPKSATLTHMRDLQFRFAWLLSMGDVEGKLEGISNAKIKHFAAEARALDAAEIRDFAPQKRYTLLLAMLHRARVTVRDNLVETYLKRIGAIHNKGKHALAELQEKHRAKMENLIVVFTEVLQTTDSVQDSDDATLGQQVRTLLATRGGAGPLLDDCAAVSAFHGNNYLPLLWRYFKSNRSELFRMARLLTLKSTSQDQTLMAALDFVLANEQRRSLLIPGELDLSFASEQWVRTVMVRDRGAWVVQRQHLEVCVFSHLAAELKSGDISVQGSENYADYRDQLLAWSDCEPMVADYCRDLGFEPGPEGFVQQLRKWLSETAAEVDRNYPDNGQVVITESGEPVLKRIVRKDLATSVVALERNLLERMPERNIIDILCNVQHYTGWTRHFGPLSGSDPKLENPVDHIRYGGYGGIAYHHVADSYIALFSHFIPCGVWEAVYIIDGLLKNKSDVQPDTLHADTQGQSLPVFALAHMLGIKLMPRIRNWKDLKFFRPSKDTVYKHIDPLFSDAVDWDLLETHWQDLLQVVLSIKIGKVLPSTLLRKLGNYSRKNRLYQAFLELGRVVRTVFLLKYISDIQLREQITASTNKVEAYNGFSKWVFFGGEGIISENDPDEQEKRIKYKDLVSNIIVFQNVVDMTFALRQLIQEGYNVTREDIATLSPYLTRHIKRFGDYVIDLEAVPRPLETELPVPM